MTSSTSRLTRAARVGAITLSVLLSLLIVFMAQASSSADYKGLFYSILPIAALNGALVAFVCVSKEKAKVWIVVIPSVLGFASYFEMACRVMFGFRLI